VHQPWSPRAFQKISDPTAQRSPLRSWLEHWKTTLHAQKLRYKSAYACRVCRIRYLRLHMTTATDAIRFLRSLWGALALIAVTFPGAAALLKLPIAVENSRIAALYPVIGVVVAAFALLMATAYRDKFASLAVARRWAVTAMSVALICFFGYVGTRVFLLDVEHNQEFLAHDGEQLVRIVKKRGIIIEDTKMKGDGLTAIPNTSSSRGDPWDVLSLALFAGVFASLSLSFTCLGLHVMFPKSACRAVKPSSSSSGQFLVQVKV
jgi:hypothetical protein